MNIGIGTNKKLVDIFNMMKAGELILRPFFQRNLVWNHVHKENFIETILLGLPFPEVYFSSGEIDLETKKSTILLVDGQQRLNSIYNYVSGSKKMILTRIKTFKELSPKEKTDFLDYNVVVRDLGRIDDDKIKEIFKRINSTQYALNAMEINNALYQGEYISLAKEIVEKGVLVEFEIFSESQYARMRDIEFILLVMTTLEVGGYFSGIKEIETYVKTCDDDYPNKDSIGKDIIEALAYLKALSLDPDSLWLTKSCFFTLMVELILFKRKNKKFPILVPLKKGLENLENKIFENRGEDPGKNKLAEFYIYIYQATASRKGRNVRGEILAEFLKTGKVKIKK